MTTSSSVGDGPWDVCTAYAGYMALHVYRDPPGAHGFDTHWTARVSDVDTNWETWDEVENSASSGLVGRLYKIKTWDPADTEAPSCPPCLSFRGTDFEDMRGLALGYKLVLYGYTLFDDVFPVGADVDADATLESMEEGGFVIRTILEESAWVWIEGATAGISAPLRISLAGKLCADANGDWASNLRQGLGERAPQYEQAKQFGSEVVNTKISQLADKRINITGHSLGGGLAACVSAFLDNEFPDIAIRGITWNAAGVHDNTLGSASRGGGNITAFSVGDEPLTSVQSRIAEVPIVGGVFSLAERTLGQNGMPEPLGNQIVLPQFDAATGARLPELFPISAQTVDTSYQGGFPVVTAIHNMILAAPNVERLGNRLLEWLNANYRNRALGRVPRTLGIYTIWGLYQTMFEILLEDLAPERAVLDRYVDLLLKYHGMDTVIASYERVRSQR